VSTTWSGFRGQKTTFPCNVIIENGFFAEYTCGPTPKGRERRKEPTNIRQKMTTPRADEPQNKHLTFLSAIHFVGIHAI
jgi:hypothetical protein